MSDIENTHLFGASSDGKHIVIVFPPVKMTLHQALVHAAWIVALAERTEGEFYSILDEVKNT